MTDENFVNDMWAFWEVEILQESGWTPYLGFNRARTPEEMFKELDKIKSIHNKPCRAIRQDKFEKEVSINERSGLLDGWQLL